MEFATSTVLVIVHFMTLLEGAFETSVTDDFRLPKREGVQVMDLRFSLSFEVL